MLAMASVACSHRIPTYLRIQSIEIFYAKLTIKVNSQGFLKVQDVLRGFVCTSVL